MLDSIVVALQSYGLIGLFLISLIGSTIFIPLVVEFYLLAIIAVGAHPLIATVIASVGSLVGSILNYYIGYLGFRIVRKKIDPQEIKRAERVLRGKYGIFSFSLLLALPVPLPVDVLTVVAGMLKMKLPIFCVIVFLSKMIRYGVVAYTGYVGISAFYKKPI